jgi:hypothetical protein
MSSKAHHSRSPFHLLSGVSRDYMARRRLVRTISMVLTIVLFSLLVAGMIVYTSDPTSFAFLR